MTKTILGCTAMFLAACTMSAGSAPARLSADDRAELAEELAGRVPGEPVSCVRRADLGSSRTFGDAVVFDGPGSTLYLNRLGPGCSGLALGRSIKVRSTGSSMCRGEIAFSFEPVSGAEYGSCPIGDFVPYRRAG